MISYQVNIVFFPLVYNTSSRETFDKLKEWLNQIEMYSTRKLDIIKMLVSNKIGKYSETFVYFYQTRLLLSHYYYHYY